MFRCPRFDQGTEQSAMVLLRSLRCCLIYSRCAPIGAQRECGRVSIASLEVTGSCRGSNFGHRLKSMPRGNQRPDAVDRSRHQPVFDCGFSVADAALAELDEGGAATVRSLALQGRTRGSEPFRESSSLRIGSKRLCIVSPREVLRAHASSQAGA